MNRVIDISDEQRQLLLDIVRQYIPDATVRAYGSRVRGTARTYSDLDLVAFTPREENRLISELKEALDESNLPFLVDLHVWDEIPESFHAIIREKYAVLQEAVPSADRLKAAGYGG
jgi:predicted nucleotidyltransferase